MRFIHRDGESAINLGKVQAMRLSHHQFSSFITFVFEEDKNASWRFKDSVEAATTYDRILSLHSETV